jgi:Uma2 family endonuclease
MLTEPISPPASQQFRFDSISWQGYEDVLRAVGDQLIYVTFDRGRMELMSPSPSHELYKELIGGLIDVLAMERSIPLNALGSATFRRKDLLRGLEPDKCYYIANAGRMRGKTDIDLAVDPPPDLVVEIDITHRSLDREAIYTAMGVPEIWRFDGNHLQALVLHGHEYETAGTSACFSGLALGEMERFVKMAASLDTTSIRMAFRDWLRTLG